MNIPVREKVLKLIAEKERLENEIRELNLVLQRNNVGMLDPLVDDEGYPLAHIDVYQVRHVRHLLISKQNDHQAVMKQIEEGVTEYYKDKAAAPPSLIKIPIIENEHPFARINMVHPGSPADSAGIKDGDLILQFGSVNGTNFRGLQDIGAVVQHSQGSRIVIKIKRDEQILKLGIMPKEWNGQGLLGCKVLPC